jgi:hypothetical protein
MNIFDVNIIVTGDCTNSNLGAATLTAVPNSNTTFPFSYLWYNPYLGTGQTQTSLSAGTYLVEVNDSSTPNNISLVNVTISSGVCASITNVVDTTCNQNNGQITISADTSSPFDNIFYIYSGGTLINSYTATSEVHTFTTLSPGIYYGVVEDAGGCTGITETCIIHESTNLSYGAFIIPATSCTGTGGKIIITGQTGTPPFTYQWSNSSGILLGQTGSTISGLTSGLYSVNVTSADNCSLTTPYNLTETNPLGAFITSASTPSCFSADGQITVTITGGTGPFFYSGSNGTTEITYATDYVFTGLSSGLFTASITDVALCNTQITTLLETPNTFNVVSVNAINSTCGASDGQINVTINGGVPPYFYQIDGPNGVQSVNSSFLTQTFTNLSGGSYTLTISATSTSCVYTQVVPVVSAPLFNISTSTTGSTCGQNNGIVLIQKTSGGTPTFSYDINGPVNLGTLSVDDNVVLTNLPSGNYTASVTSQEGCIITSSFFIQTEPPLNFTLFGTDCGLGNEGTITAIITSGIPPFTISWFPSVSSGIYATGLTSGNYSVTITDSNNCTDTQEFEVSCSALYSGYRTFRICSDIMELSYGNKFGLIEMLNYGFQDITTGDTTCILNNAQFIASVTANSTTVSGSVYTSFSLIDVPTDEQLYGTIKTLLESISGVGEVIIDYTNNQIIINSDCTLNNNLNDIGVKAELTIIYDITCDDV